MVKQLLMRLPDDKSMARLPRFSRAAHTPAALALLMGLRRRPGVTFRKMQASFPARQENLRDAIDTALRDFEAAIVGTGRDVDAKRALRRLAEFERRIDGR
jgi:hypothetical protein